MQTVEHLRDLYLYDDWANHRTIAALEAAASDRSRRILAHILITKQEYFERLDGKDSTGFDFWPDLDLEACNELARTTAGNFKQILDNSDEAGLERTAKYKNSQGVPYEDNYRDLLTHVLIHSSIHRGNIVIKMREEGLEPPQIDYILYLRAEE